MTYVYGPPRPLERAEWEQESLCRQSDPEIWQPAEQSKRGDPRAIRTCLRCPVLFECRWAAIDNREQYGVWGAMGEAELLEMRRGGPRTDHDGRVQTRGTKLPPDVVQGICDALRADVPHTKIADQFRISERTVRYYRTGLGLAPRKVRLEIETKRRRIA